MEALRRFRGGTRLSTIEALSKVLHGVPALLDRKL